MVYAGAIDRLIGAGAKAIILDVLLFGAREGDQQLYDALVRHPGKVVIMSNFVQDQGADGGAIIRFQTPDEDSLPPGTAVGFANFWRSEDGVVRSAPFRMRVPAGDVVYSSPAMALGLLKGREAMEELPDSSLFIPSLQGLAPDVRVPLWQLFSQREWKSNLKGGEVFRDRVIAIGASAPQFHDEFVTPLGTFIGAGLHLAALAAAWTGAFYSPASGWFTLAGLSLGVLLTALAWIVPKNTTTRIGLIVAGLVVAVPAAHFLLEFTGIMPPLSGFMFATLISSVSNLSMDLILEVREKQRTRNALERYVSPGLAKEILDNKAEFLQSLGGARRDVTILFSDVRDFTANTEVGDPTELFEQLNEYFGYMVSEILGSGGAIDKFMGDGILAVWGTLSRRSPEEEATAAISCSLAMRNSLDHLNAQRTERGLPPWKIGIGIHSGSVLFGNVGSQARMEPTVIGDPVNLASRVEGLTKALKSDILVTEATKALAGNEALYRQADLVRVVGRGAPTEVFTYWPEGTSEEDRRDHEAGIRLFRSGDFAGASKVFGKMVERKPQDLLAGLYIRRCASYQASPPPADWAGVFQAETK
jgi:adenylate cyclase